MTRRMAAMFSLRTNFLGGPSPRLKPTIATTATTLSTVRALASSSSSSPSQASGSNQHLKLGFLGLGIMGTAMARNLVKAGYDVTVWNRSASKCEALVSEGARRGSTPKNVTEMCDVTFAMLADPVAALEVALGSDGALGGLGPGKGYVDVSTVDAGTTKTVCEAVKSSGSLFLEAPVSGSKKPAEEGKLIFLAAGDKELYDTVVPMLDVMGKSRFYLGAPGNGAAMKIVVNMIMGSMMASFAEGLMLGDKAGLDPQTILEVLSQGAINNPMFSLKGPTMLARNYTPAFPLKHQQKDLRLALDMSDKLLQNIPIAAAANEVYKVAKGNGLGDDDFSAVIEAFRNK
ncbi:glyoxylate/succinic semialdehyde reductase 2, chloroplastic [Selaginella moellendorffii]|uniref:glyoxylate/succinic semialdehyde reductase 2, chloroplastic n=1 Tax=Selaginella moellendorffii TaxID=88036 RepID=UPI000D1C42A9|nr:glyoxylate/succinic semialdehyde reductase 2, chloroplastic [Selaginella moellendorffii]|eukprot:XP_024536741.1 glyoxylate/succinic semialdehyde reductase 2, chloroplastic [Selaginella moellendorffii]